MRLGSRRPEFNSLRLTSYSGEYDFIVCGGYCPGILATGTTESFPASKNLVTYSQPGSGHGINLSVSLCLTC